MSTRTNPLAGWRLPLRLAARDLRRYKGRSALAALLILVPVLAMATLLSALRTGDITDSKLMAHELRNVAASVAFDAGNTKPVAFPAAGKVVGGTGNQPTTAQVAQQAKATVVRQDEQVVRLAPATGGPSFTPTDDEIFRQTDLASPLVKPSFTLDSGRLPSKPGEVVVTRVGRLHGLPDHGTIKASVTSSSSASSSSPASSSERAQHPLIIVGTVTSFSSISLMGPPVAELTSPDANTRFLIGGHAWSDAQISAWYRYGAIVSTPASWSPETPSALESPGSKVVVAITTMVFIAVTALLAGPAFAASATRQRRTLGLIAANGATRAGLRRVVLAQALLLGALTAVVATSLGGVLGAYGASRAHLHFLGTPAPIDIPVSWLVGLTIVATIASLVSAFIPARSAGHTNLLAALRGQVSSRAVKRRWPLIGLAGIGLGILCLVGATTTTDSNNDTRNVALVYLGVPLFFGGAVLAVPYFLLLIGRLARFLPVSARIALRDVSRQRTRATASVGAVLATVSVLCAASTFGASYDRFNKATYYTSMKVGSGAFTSMSPGQASEVDLTAALPKIRELVPSAIPMWAAGTTSGYQRLTTGSCTVNAPIEDQTLGTAVLAITQEDAVRAGLPSAAQSMLEKGGAIVLQNSSSTYSSLGWLMTSSIGPDSIKNGTLRLNNQNPTMSHDHAVQRDCTAKTFPAMTATWPLPGLGAVPAGTVIVNRSTLDHAGVPSIPLAISVDPGKPISTTTEHRLAALAPTQMPLLVEHGYRSPLKWILVGLTAGFALIILLTTIVSTLLNDAESQADMATLAAAGAPRGMRRRIVGAHAAAIGFIGAVGGIVVGFIPGLIMARAVTSTNVETGQLMGGTYAVAWWPLLTMLVTVPLIAALISMLFARRTPTLTRREA